MSLDQSTTRRGTAAKTFNDRFARSDGERVTASLCDGLTVLRNAFFQRVSEDVISRIGMDSMLMPVSPLKAEEICKTEIELFQIAEATLATKNHVYVDDPDQRFGEWLTEFRLGAPRLDFEHRRRLDSYISGSSRERRLLFTNVLADVLPESRRAPLVLYRLHPAAVWVVTAVAFGDHRRACEYRGKQRFHLPAIDDCHECLGRPLDNSEQCGTCGNPVWKYDWLTAAD
jgi:hypothetical protein